MKKKILILALSVICLALLLGGMLAANADTGAATDIPGHNLALEEGVHIVYYVDQTVPAGAEAGVLCWEAPQESYTLENKQYQLSQAGTYTRGGNTYARYELPLPAKKMTVDIYAVSYVKVGNTVIYSELDKYSVLQYCYNKKSSTSVLGDGTATLGEIVTVILDYGTIAQKYFNANTDRLANANYYNISVKDGTLADGTTSGLFQQGQTVTLTAPEGKGEFLFSYWKDEGGVTVGTTREMQITVGTSNKTYTAVFDTVEEQPDDPAQTTYDVQFSFDCDTTPAAGEEFVVTLSVESVDTAEITAMLFYGLQYDNTVLEFKEYVAKELTMAATAGTNAISGQPSVIPLGFTPNRVANGEVFDLKFRVKDGITAGTETAISMTATVSRNGQAIRGINVLSPSCTITIGSQGGGTPDDPAQETYDVQFSFDCDTTPAAGEEFHITLSVESVDTAEITAMLFYGLQYDNTVLEFKGYSAKELTNAATAGTNAISGQPSVIPLGFTPNRVANGEVFDLTFTVKSGVAAGTKTAVSMTATVSRNGQAIDGITVCPPSCTVTIANP